MLDRVEFKEIIAKYGDIVLSPMVISLHYCCWAKSIMNADAWNGTPCKANRTHKKVEIIGTVLFVDYEKKKYKTEDCKIIVVERIHKEHVQSEEVKNKIKNLKVKINRLQSEIDKIESEIDKIESEIDKIESNE